MNLSPFNGARPCRFCIAYHGVFADAETCELAHQRMDASIYYLASKLSRCFQGPAFTDEHVGWMLEDADVIIRDFDPEPESWRVRKLPQDDAEFVARFRVNDVTYIIENGEGYCQPERLSEYRKARRG